MTEFIFFIVGLLLGGCIGVVFMCCLQINRLYKTDSMKRRSKQMKRRTVKKQFWFSRDEAQDLAKKAKKTCLTEAAFVRLLVRGYEPKENPTSVSMTRCEIYQLSATT